MGKGNLATSREKFNTLAQSGTADFDTYPDSSVKMVFGTGTDLTDKKAWKGRAKRKMITRTMMLNLIEVAEQKGQPERKQAFWNTFHCQERLFSSEGRVYGRYCKNRFCTLCCAIRKAEIINRYLPEITTWKDPYFVTLTIKAVPAERLDWALRGIKRAFRQIREKYKKMNQRGKGAKLIGVKSLECNFNPVAKTYNPHLHLIVPDRETAVTLIVEWLKKWTKKFARPWAQYMRRVNCVERDLVEIIKYGSKIFTEPDLKKKAQKKVPPVIYAAALDTILCAMKPYRIFERFGFNLPKKPENRNLSPAILERYEEWVYQPALHDWHNPETGELMTGYLPTPQILFLLREHVDTDLQ